jgi:hypothetical protein
MQSDSSRASARSRLMQSDGVLWTRVESVDEQQASSRRALLMSPSV